MSNIHYPRLQHSSPSYLNKKPKLQSTRSSRSSSAVTLYRPYVKLETAKRSFSFAVPLLWNSHATTIRHSGTYSLTSQAARQCSPVVMVTSGLNGATLFLDHLYTKPMDRRKPKFAGLTRLGTYIDLPNLVEIGSL